MRIILSKTEQVGPNTWTQVFKTVDVELPDVEKLLRYWSFVGVEIEAASHDRCPYCGCYGCVCAHTWGESCRCGADTGRSK